MPRSSRFPACLLLFILFAPVAFGASARAQERSAVRSTTAAAPPSELPLPDRGGTAWFQSSRLFDAIRRTYDRPQGTLVLDPADALPSLLNSAVKSGSAITASLPLPLPPDLWIKAVFDGRETPQTLLDGILRSRRAALLYYGLFALDDDTREWLTLQPRLVAELAGGAAASFVVAAPGLRVREGKVQAPAGEAAAPAWAALVGHRLDDPAGFTRALLARDAGKLALFFGTIAQLTPGEQRVALRLDGDEAARIDAIRRLRAAFDQVLVDWRADAHVFWRPALDPALLISSLRRGPDGVPVVPGTVRFWSEVFGTRAAGSEAMHGLSFAWLVEQLFTGERRLDRHRYDAVLFVSRLSGRDPRWMGEDGIEATRAVLAFPSLVLSLERAGLVDAATYAVAGRRAARIAAIKDPDRATRSLAQFQGALALVLRAAARSAMRPESLARVVSSLCEVDLSEGGDYEGRLVPWVHTWLTRHLEEAPAAPFEADVAGPVELQAMSALAGPADATPRMVDWEGTRYRLDFAGAEGRRIAHQLGETPRPLLSSARAVVELADDIRYNGLTRAGAASHLATLETIAGALGWGTADARGATTRPPAEYREVHSRIQRATRQSTPPAARITADLVTLADHLLGRGLTEFAYAVALGHSERTTISAAEAASRHDFAQRLPGRRALAWERASSVSGPSRHGWRVTGSLLDLDVELAEFHLLRLSLRPPARKPTVAHDLRRVLVETSALADAASLADADRTRIVAAMRDGRARLLAARSAADAAAIADQVRLSPIRRTLLAWTVSARREALPGFLSLTELLWLGLQERQPAERLHAWGAAARPRTGCLCLEMLDPHPWEQFAGRLHSGSLASGFPDLNLRLAEILEELQMPAALLAPLLAAATLDLIESAAARDADDRQALVDFVRDLRTERVEEYLALLTSDGPLVPVEPGGGQ